MTEKHTAAPWIRSEEYSQDYYYSGYSISTGNDDDLIADCINEEADADLIAAAPDLLEALELVATDVDWHKGSPTLKLIKAAINKAKGLK